MWSRARRWLSGSLRRRRLSSSFATAASPEVVWRLSDHGLEGESATIVAEIAPARPYEVAAVRAWQRRQSFRPLWMLFHPAPDAPRVALDPESNLASPATVPPTRWRAWLPELPDGAETLIESAFLVAASERVDAVAMAPGPATASTPPPDPAYLYLGDRCTVDQPSGAFAPLQPGRLVKLAALTGTTETPLPPVPGFHHRRGPYAGDRSLPSPLVVEVTDPSVIPRRGPAASAPRILVLAPFLARGGAEHTLFETTRRLAERREFEFAFATLAPHRRELGDRRDDFRAVGPLIYSLGDHLHPGAMYGALLSLVDALGIRLLYNANGSTLFYEFARRLRRDRPGLPIVDHLYDHRVGYIEWYTPDLVSTVDWCIAENHPIAETLVAGHGWRRERAPVLWPCGRPAGAFPAEAERAAIRRRLRRELGIDDSRLLVLTAARAHPQKRPFDWLRLAERLRDRPFDFLWVGGGDLEQELDRALAGAATRHARRLPFRDDIPELLLAADVGCLVSDFEGLPVFLLESLQAGRPFVATDVGDIARVLRPSGAGRVAGQPGDLDGLEHALLELLDPARRSAAGAAASRAGEQFGVEACADRYAALFHAAMAG